MRDTRLLYLGREKHNDREMTIQNATNILAYRSMTANCKRVYVIIHHLVLTCKNA